MTLINDLRLNSLKTLLTTFRIQGEKPTDPGSSVTLKSDTVRDLSFAMAELVELRKANAAEAQQKSVSEVLRTQLTDTHLADLSEFGITFTRFEQQSNGCVVAAHVPFEDVHIEVHGSQRRRGFKVPTLTQQMDEAPDGFYWVYNMEEAGVWGIAQKSDGDWHIPGNDYSAAIGSYWCDCQDWVIGPRMVAPPSHPQG